MDRIFCDSFLFKIDFYKYSYSLFDEICDEILYKISKNHMNNLKIYEDLFLQNPQPICICIIHNSSWKVIQSNNAFIHFIGNVNNSEFVLNDIIQKQDLQNFQDRLQFSNTKQFLQSNIHVLTKGKMQENALCDVVRDVKMSVQKVIHEKQELLLCILEDISIWKDTEKELKKTLKQEQNRLLQYAQLFDLNKQIANHNYDLFQLMSELQTISTQKELLTKTLTLLNSLFNYFSDIAIYLIQNDLLQLAISNKQKNLQNFHMKKNHRYAMVARGDTKIFSINTGEIILPILTPLSIIGIIVIQIQAKDSFLFYKESQVILQHFLESFCLYFGLKWYSLNESLEKNLSIKHPEQCIVVFLHCDSAGTMLLNERQQVAQILNDLFPDLYSLNFAEYAFKWIGTKEIFNSWVLNLKKILNQKNISPITICCIPAINYNSIQEMTSLFYYCLEFSVKQGGNKIYEWDYEHSQVVEIIEMQGNMLE